MAAERRFSNEWLAGATLGGYVILSVVLYSFGRELIRYYCGTEVSQSTTGALVFLIPGAVVGFLGFGQIRLARLSDSSSLRKAIRVALWLNVVSIASLCVAFALQTVDELDWVRLGAAITALACFAVGLLASITNLLWAMVHRLRA